MGLMKFLSSSVIIIVFCCAFNNSFSLNNFYYQKLKRISNGIVRLKSFQFKLKCSSDSKIESFDDVNVFANNFDEKIGIDVVGDKLKEENLQMKHRQTVPQEKEKKLSRLNHARSEEVKKKISDSVKLRWQDPEFREEMLSKLQKKTSTKPPKQPKPPKPLKEIKAKKEPKLPKLPKQPKEKKPPKEKKVKVPKIKNETKVVKKRLTKADKEHLLYEKYINSTIDHLSTITSEMSEMERTNFDIFKKDKIEIIDIYSRIKKRRLQKIEAELRIKKRASAIERARYYFQNNNVTEDDNIEDILGRDVWGELYMKNVPFHIAKFSKEDFNKRLIEKFKRESSNNYDPRNYNSTQIQLNDDSSQSFFNFTFQSNSTNSTNSTIDHNDIFEINNSRKNSPIDNIINSNEKNNEENKYRRKNIDLSEDDISNEILLEMTETEDPEFDDQVAVVFEDGSMQAFKMSHYKTLVLEGEYIRAGMIDSDQDIID